MCGPNKTTINNEVKDEDVMPAIDMKVADILIGSTSNRKKNKVAKGIKQLDFTEIAKGNQNNLNIKPVSHDIGYIANQQQNNTMNTNSLRIR